MAHPVCVCVYIYIYIVFSHKLWYMLLGTEFVFLYRIRPEYWVMLVANKVNKILFCYNEKNEVISSTNFNAQFSLFINNMFVTLLSSTLI